MKLKPTTDLEKLGGIFLLFARLFSRPPTTEVVRDVKTLGWAEGDQEPETLQVEFTRLFSAPTPEAIPAHQSIYTDTLAVEASDPDPTGCGLSFAGGAFQGYLGGESCSAAGRFYKIVGFVPLDPAPAMADHISNELAFMGYFFLTENRFSKNNLEGEAKSYEELRNIFWTQFLSRWIREFAKKVATNPVSAFYRKVGRELLTKIISPPDTNHMRCASLSIRTVADGNVPKEFFAVGLD